MLMTNGSDEMTVERKDNSFSWVMSSISRLIKVKERISREIIAKPSFNDTLSDFRERLEIGRLSLSKSLYREGF